MNSFDIPLTYKKAVKYLFVSDREWNKRCFNIREKSSYKQFNSSYRNSS